MNKTLLLAAAAAFSLAISGAAYAKNPKTVSPGTSWADKTAEGWTDVSGGNQGSNGKNVGNAGGTKPAETSTDTGSTDTGTTDAGSTPSQ